jgi:hypothetical protein
MAQAHRASDTPLAWTLRQPDTHKGEDTAVVSNPVVDRAGGLSAVIMPRRETTAAPRKPGIPCLPIAETQKESIMNGSVSRRQFLGTVTTAGDVVMALGSDIEEWP